MSDFKHYDEDTEDSDFVYDEDFDAETFLDTMTDTTQLRRRPSRAKSGRSALELIERRNEERWLRAQLSDLDDELTH